MTPSECENACKCLFKGEVHRSSSPSHKGLLLCPVEGIAKLAQPLPLPADATTEDLMNLVHSCFARNFDIGIGWSAPLPLHFIVARWQDSLDYTLKLTSNRIHSLFDRDLFSNAGSSMPFHITSIGARTQRKHLVSPNDPTTHALRLLGGTCCNAKSCTSARPSRMGTHA